MDIRHLNVAYGERVIYNDFSVHFPDGHITALLGPSGCGKTTLLNSIAFGEYAADVSYIFQEPRLLPWCTIEKNIMLTLRGSRQERKDRADEYLRKVGLEKRAGEYPARLSGGERQRASIARAFSCPSHILLMDEPFQSQDVAIKRQLIELVLELQAIEKRTVIAVTHDIHEAADLADRAIVISGSPVSILLDIPVSAGLELQLSEVLSCQTSIL